MQERSNSEAVSVDDVWPLPGLSFTPHGSKHSFTLPYPRYVPHHISRVTVTEVVNDLDQRLAAMYPTIAHSLSHYRPRYPSLGIADIFPISSSSPQFTWTIEISAERATHDAAIRGTVTNYLIDYILPQQLCRLTTNHHLKVKGRQSKMLLVCVTTVTGWILQE